MKAALFCVSVSLLQCLPAQARSPKEDLEPVASAFTHHSPGYQLALRKVLFEKAPRQSLAQFLVLPSFSPEMLASVYQVYGGFEVQVTRAGQDIWNQGELVGEQPVSRERDGVRIVVVRADQEIRWDLSEVGKTPCDTSRTKLPDPVALRLKDVWRRMLQRARYQQSGATILDGTRYVFLSFDRAAGWWSGQTHSPSEGTRAAALVELGEALVAYVDCAPDAREEALARMNGLMDTLASMLSDETGGRGGGKGDGASGQERSGVSG